MCAGIVTRQVLAFDNLKPLPLIPRPAAEVSAETPKTLAKTTMAGTASWYGRVLQNHYTASGERFDMHLLTASHRDLPFGTIVRVWNSENGKSVVVRINDRGELPENRIDLSYEAAHRLGMLKIGIADVKMEVLKNPEFDRTNRSPTSSIGQ